MNPDASVKPETIQSFFRRLSMARIFFGLAIVLLMGTLNAWVDMALHPDIPFFDEEHLIVGGVAVVVTAVLLIILERRTYLNMEVLRKLNQELDAQVAERTRQLVDAQEELVRKEKLSILGRLAGSVGHELRNPLGVMNNAVYFLEMVLSDADQTIKEYLEILRSEIGNSNRIISDLLEFARTRAPRTATAAARELITSCLARCAVPQNILLCTEIPEALPAVRVDPLQMGQVFENLIMNAVQAMPEGGVLTIRATPARDAGNLEISVIDTGKGISEENMEKLFQPLFTTKSRGIGLGLVVCRNLTEANGGRIEVESRSGQGATFTVILPAEGNKA